MDACDGRSAATYCCPPVRNMRLRVASFIRARTYVCASYPFAHTCSSLLVVHTSHHLSQSHSSRHVAHQHRHTHSQHKAHTHSAHKADGDRASMHRCTTEVRMLLKRTRVVCHPSRVGLGLVCCLLASVACPPHRHNLLVDGTLQDQRTFTTIDTSCHITSRTQRVTHRYRVSRHAT